ncbi:S41 family peptidase [Inhella gelatinilytica]|uniref:PDZ domain-containing protein n=1 Tax=Inhella gelatinilytica TaxID=2795030 RepID=A0A931NFL4_9BURK|nr:S41 family peptidase [Inhella gelatinilytica]MBH9553671.1 hypothetical protein [Inhella gelatinilytica]
MLSVQVALQAPRAIRLRAGLALGALSLLLGCAAVPGPAPTDAVGREDLLTRVWQLIDDRHVDPAPSGWAEARERHRAAVLAAPPDDPEALWVALDRMAGERRDAHTRVEGPREVRRKRDDRGPSLGLALAQVEGQWVVDRVTPDSPAAAVGLTAGDRLLRWNGEAPDAVWARGLAQARHSSTAQAQGLTALRQWLDGPEGSEVALQWEQADGRVRSATLKRAELLFPPRAQLTRRDSGVAVLRWNRFDERLLPELTQALRDMGGSPGRGLILDLRGNGGGSFDLTMRLLDLLLPESQVVQLSAFRNGPRRDPYRAGGPKALYKGPLRVLMDAGSASGSELLASVLQFTGRARVLGDTSCGCLLAIRRHVDLAPDARLLISEQALQLPDGRRVEGQGVQPDRRINRTRAALAVGRDEVLEAAEAELTSTWP